MNHQSMTTIQTKLGISRSSKTTSMDNSTEPSSLKSDTSVSIPDHSCGLTMLYLGPPMMNSGGSYKFKIHADEILILQSHTKTGTKSVFKGCIKPNESFTFKSCRLMDHHFEITIYINGIIDHYVFVCCEKGFVNQSNFQIRSSSCQLQSITGGIPCQTCQSLELMNFFSNENQYDDSNYIGLTSSQAITSPTKETLIQSVSKSLTKSNPVTDTTKDDKEHNLVVGTDPTIYNQNASETQTSTHTQEPKNVNEEEMNQKDNQSIGNVMGGLKQTNENIDSKISNEDKKAKISSEANLKMEQLLNNYITLLVPQKESSTSNSESNNTTELFTYSSLTESDREAKATMQYTHSMPLSTIDSKAESFVLIWLDQTIQKNQDTVESEQKLRASVNSLVTCHTISEAMNVINQIQDQQIYLIVSGQLGKELISTNRIIDSSKVNSIYIFCRDQFKYTELVQPFNKIRGVFIEIDPLCARLKEDTEHELKNLLPISTTSGTSAESSADEKNQVKFLCSQLHRDLLFTMEYNNNAKMELVDFCSNIYKSSPTELKYIDELRNDYHAGEAIGWYSRPTFLYKMLNKAFLTQDISVLHKFHFFIKDLHTRLEQMHSLYKPSLASRVFTVYRGLKMTTEDFKKTIRDEINNLIAFDSFLSTSLDPNIAKQFALDKQNPRSESVVFSMEIDADQMERPFADITHWSDFKHEREVLFSIGTVFRIVDVADEKTSDGIWMVYLSTVSEKDAQLQKETQQIQITLLRFFQDVLDGQYKVNNEEKIPGSNANVASMHYKLGEYEHSLVFYKKALTTLRNLKSPDRLTQATYISNVAKVHMALGHDIEALGLYKEALDIRRKICKCNDPSLIHTLHTIGHIYRGKGNLNAAFEQYDEALKLQLSPLDSRLSPDFSSIAVTYICIGNIFDRQRKYPEALKSFLNALEQQQKYLQEEHPVLAFLYNNIGAMHYKMNRYDLALENQLKCLKIELKSLPKEHKTFAETYKNIATAYEKRGQFDEAIEYAQKYVDQLKLHSLEASEELNDAIDLLKRNQRIRDIRK